ncbi:inositol monophosphatase family protein [Candidatus Uabimicrobium amorphum]|uniref:Inositol monophosphatase n=1 Tax=Uabimicrobium amorphum TaxID=2596890 RepID=A0A5S9F2H8_UABAM|nr:inositol monophosphatase [Candidatus Uabimicrobium amorphum]BBM82479.1 inositol monophosphatase [Candidatus Uabimicrobium amorphum]
MTDKDLIRQALKVSRDAVRLAAKEVLKLQQQKGFLTSFKKDDSPVTAGDKIAEQIIVEAIQNHFPQHKILSEEFGKINFRTKSPFLWVLDPIDGTWSYVNQEITMCIQVALLKNSQCISATIYHPFTKAMYQTSLGKVATLNRRHLPFTNYQSLKRAVVNYHIPRSQTKLIYSLIDLWKEYRIAKLITQGGSIAYSLACVAKGSHTCFITTNDKTVKAWDLCAGVTLIRNMGGCVTNFQGENVSPVEHKGGIIASCNKKVHKALLKCLANYEFNV